MLLDEFDFFAELRLHELEEYLNTTEKYLKKAKSDFEASANEQAKELSTANPDLRADEIDDILSNDYWRYSETFPRILRNSFLVSALSLLEHEVSVVCKRLKKERPTPINLGNLKGDTLERARLFFKVAGLNLKCNSQTWQEIRNYYLVRNCIAHNGGLIDGLKDEKELSAYVTRKGIISQDTIEEELALTGQFCKEIIQTMRVFMEELNQALAEKKLV